MMLKEDLARMRQSRGTGGAGPSTRQQTPSFTHGQEPPSHHRYSAPQPETLAPIRTTVTLKRNNYSIPSALNALREDLSDKIPGGGGGGVMQAWHSNPSSRNPSRNPSRQSSSRNPRPNTIHGRTSSYDTNEIDQDELFYDVPTYPFSKKTVSDSSDSLASTFSPLPSINETRSAKPSKRKRSTPPPERKNGHTRSEVVIRTELGVEEVIAEIMRAAHSLKIREVDKTGPSSLTFTWGGVKMRVVVSKEQYFECGVNFQWISGGDPISYREKCDKLSRKIKL